MPDGREPTTWAAALDAFAVVLERNERHLAEDRWDAADVALGVPPAVPAGPPSAADRARGAVLLARAADQERRLRAEREAAAAALGEVGLRRTAARRYTA